MSFESFHFRLGFWPILDYLSNMIILQIQKYFKFKLFVSSACNAVTTIYGFFSLLSFSLLSYSGECRVSANCNVKIHIINFHYYCVLCHVEIPHWLVFWSAGHLVWLRCQLQHPGPLTQGKAQSNAVLLFMGNGFSIKEGLYLSVGSQLSSQLVGPVFFFMKEIRQETC